MICRVRYLAILILACGLLSACADTKGPTTRPSSMRDRQEQALRDPYGYNPDEMPTVSGGATGHLDKKALKRDVDSFWNP